ncbi:hypothetical protein SAMN05421820_114113 [Pedobacter steynii]|uniref:Uncharacterized protein n=1 Tax=Pedobacter steynii TaxID=430522 RepID=A0A1H0J924_9SPHI|nr:hypothetical protein [Pedobacter steynii]NQX43062.1 hypothetical protein [Pedobacter steynii]SDO39979.1 hypothetical protein SAMN05421820_114113 [Pedobacter steynii]
MTRFKVIEIVDIDVIKLSPDWKVIEDGVEISGQTVKILGYTATRTEEFEVEYTMDKLKILLLNKSVFLANPVLIPDDENMQAKISCKVLLNDIDIANYFPEYRPKSLHLI